MKKIASLIIILGLVFSCTFPSYAQEKNMSLTNAKNYLLNYEELYTKQDGSSSTTHFEFKTEEQLEAAAQYIVDYGFDSFWQIVNESISEQTAKDSDRLLDSSRSVNPLTAYVNVSGNGTHNVSAIGLGTADCGNLGPVEYTVELGYRATVANNVFTSVNNIYINIIVSTAGGSYSDISFNSYYNNHNCGVTANYKITKSITVPIPGSPFGFDIISDYDLDSFALLTTLVD